MSKFGDVVGKVSGEALELAVRAMEERAAFLGTIRDLSRAADELKRQMWEGIKEVVPMEDGRKYTFDALTGEVSDDGPDVIRQPHTKPWGRLLDALKKPEGGDK